jgi:hypothetical protein
MKDRLVADLDARIARHARGDSSGVLEEHALTVVTELAALGPPDAGSLARVAALHLCRYLALPPEQGEIDRRFALALYTKLHSVDPRLVAPEVRDLLGLASPPDVGIALLREYERSGRVDQLERAISLLRQEVLESRADRAGGLCGLGTALVRRFERFGDATDLHEAIDCGRAGLAAAAADDPRRAGFRSGLAAALLRRYDLTAERTDLDDAIALCRDVVRATAGGPDHATALANLTQALSRRP